MRGFLCASMNILPNDPKFLELSGEELRFLYHYKKKYVGGFMNDLAVMLGVRWTPESVHTEPDPNNKKKKPGESETIDLPLALAMNPKLGKWLKQHVNKPQGSKTVDGDVEIVSGLGYDKIREHQKRLLSQAKQILDS
jgi:hypothetical protein